MTYTASQKKEKDTKLVAVTVWNFN